MDVIALVAERKIQEAIEDGFFDNLLPYGRIDCSLQGDAFKLKWWREKIAREEAFNAEPRSTP